MPARRRSPGELCNKNFFSTSWQNDQTPMAMGEYLNSKGVKSLYVVGPNYAAGKDMLAGVKRTYKGELKGEDYTKWPDQLDFSAELTKIGAAKPDGIFIFYPGAHGVQFVKQWAQSGLNKTVPLYQVFSIDAITLPQQGELALGTLGAQEWVNDLPNEQNKRYVADFKKKHNVYPSYYGAQSYDAIMLIASAAEALKGDLSNKDKVRAELKKANFKSLRGDFKFNTNQFPIQNFYIQETVKDPGRHDDGQDHRHRGEGRQGLLLREVPDEVRPLPGARRCDNGSAATRSRFVSARLCRDDGIPADPGAERRAARAADVPARRRADADLRHHGSGQPGARLALHDGRLHRLDLRHLDRFVRARRAARAAGDLRCSAWSSRRRHAPALCAATISTRCWRPSA